MGSWNSNSKTHVSSMKSGDFHHNEKSFCTNRSTNVSIELFLKSGDVIVLKKKIFHCLMEKLLILHLCLKIN